jgi:hypothetical protein
MAKYYRQLKDDFYNCLACIRVEVILLDGSSLLEQRNFLEAGGDQLRPLIWIFGLEISADRTTFVEDEAVVVLRGIGKSQQLRICKTKDQYVRYRGLHRMAVS